MNPLEEIKIQYQPEKVLDEAGSDTTLVMLQETQDRLLKQIQPGTSRATQLLMRTMIDNNHPADRVMVTRVRKDGSIENVKLLHLVT